MKNNGGWGLLSMFWLCAWIVLAFFVFLYFLNKMVTLLEINNKSLLGPRMVTINYSNIENVMANAAEDYSKRYDKEIKKNGKTIVTVKRLQELNLISTIEVKNKLCTGYVIIENSLDNFKYDPYLKCDILYETENYASKYDNMYL